MNKPSVQRDNSGALTIKISSDAVNHIRSFGNLEGKNKTNLRVAVKGGGCSGLTYVLQIVDTPPEDEKIIITEWKTQGIKVGDTFNIFKKGDVVTNPQTGMKIELPGELIGTIKITNTVGSNINDEICIAEGLKNKIEISNFKNYYGEEIAND